MEAKGPPVEISATCSAINTSWWPVSVSDVSSVIRTYKCNVGFPDSAKRVFCFNNGSANPSIKDGLAVLSFSEKRLLVDQIGSLSLQDQQAKKLYQFATEACSW